MATPTYEEMSAAYQRACDSAPPEDVYVLAGSPEEARANDVANFVKVQGCAHCGKPFGEHWAPYAFCSIDETVTPETATRFTAKH